MRLQATEELVMPSRFVAHVSGRTVVDLFVKMELWRVEWFSLRCL